MNTFVILILGFSVFCTFAGFFLGVYGFTRFLKAITEEEFVPVVSFLLSGLILVILSRPLISYFDYNNGREAALQGKSIYSYERHNSAEWLRGWIEAEDNE